MEHAKHIVRAVLLLVLVGVAFVFVRHFAIPESFGLYGGYRYNSLGEHVMGVSPVHGAPGACANCHDEETRVVSAGKHHAVSCEVCHAPLGTHVQVDERVAEMLTQRSSRLCARCHARLAARPADFPQVVLPDHVTEQGVEMAEEVCWECHENAHSPTEE